MLFPDVRMKLYLPLARIVYNTQTSSFVRGWFAGISSVLASRMVAQLYQIAILFAGKERNSRSVTVALAYKIPYM